MFVCLGLCVSICLSVCPSVCPPVCLPFALYVCLSLWLFGWFVGWLGCGQACCLFGFLSRGIAAPRACVVRPVVVSHGSTEFAGLPIPESAPRVEPTRGRMARNIGLQQGRGVRSTRRFLVCTRCGRHCPANSYKRPGCAPSASGGNVMCICLALLHVCGACVQACPKSCSLLKPGQAKPGSAQLTAPLDAQHGKVSARQANHPNVTWAFAWARPSRAAPFFAAMAGLAITSCDIIFARTVCSSQRSTR